MVARCLWCDDEARGDLLVRKPARKQPQHLDFTRGESRGPVAPPPHSMARGPEHRLDGIAIEMTGAHLGTQLGRRLFRCECATMWAWFAHRLVCVGSTEDARRASHRRTAETARIPGAV